MFARRKGPLAKLQVQVVRNADVKPLYILPSENVVLRIEYLADFVLLSKLLSLGSVNVENLQVDILATIPARRVNPGNHAGPDKAYSSSVLSHPMCLR